jgi:hypothetical protein
MVMGGAKGAAAGVAMVPSLEMQVKVLPSVQ